MVKEILIIGLVLILLYSLAWNYQQKKDLAHLSHSGTQQKTNYQQRIRQLETQIYHTDRNIVKARQDF